MPECAFENAAVLLLDPIGANLTATRQALTATGFERIDAVSDVNQLRQNLQFGDYQLVIAETNSAPEDVVQLAHQIRAGEQGGDPFVTLMLTMWAREESGVVAALNSGADDIVLRPFSTKFLAGRIRTLTTARKSFLVTSDYIGPVRGMEPALDGAVNLIKVPSTLHAAAQGDADALTRARQEIADARQRVERERVRRLAMRVAAAARMNLTTKETMRLRGLEHMRRATEELTQRATALGGPEAALLVEVLAKIASQASSDQTLSPAKWRLAQTIAMGVYAAIKETDTASRSANEVNQTLAALRRRLSGEDAELADAA